MQSPVLAEHGFTLVADEFAIEYSVPVGKAAALAV
jgi:hypothetical protein